MKIPPPCPFCGAQERWNAESQRFENIVHDYSKHPGFTQRLSNRLTTEDLMQLPDSSTLDRLGGQREA